MNIKACRCESRGGKRERRRRDREEGRRRREKERERKGGRDLRVVSLSRCERSAVSESHRVEGRSTSENTFSKWQNRMGVNVGYC